MLPQAVLHIDFLRLVAREGDVETEERAGLEVLLPFELVEEVEGEVALADYEPARAF